MAKCRNAGIKMAKCTNLGIKITLESQSDPRPNFVSPLFIEVRDEWQALYYYRYPMTTAKRVSIYGKHGTKVY